MKEADEQEKLRNYILGGIGDDKARSTIEERIMTDDDYFQQLTMVEEILIQDYVDANLSAADSLKFEKSFLVSEENRQRVKFARALRKYVDENAPADVIVKKPSFFDSLRPFFSSPVPAAFVALIILGFAGYFIWKSVSVPASKDSEVLIALNKAYRAERPVESRITDLEYAPPKNTRGAEGDNKTDKIERELAKSIALTAVSKDASAENLHALGRVYLAEKNFDDAIEQFEKAAALDPNNAKLHNDLGVALMEKAKAQQEKNLEILTRAGEEFSRAIELDKDLDAAYFNRALFLQTMPASPQSKEAWQKYLERDSNSKWAQEARDNLKTLETTKPISKSKEEILQEFLQAKQANDHEKAWQTLSKNREITKGKLIPQQLAFLFVDAKSNSDLTQAQTYLEALVYAGKLEEEKSGDLFWKKMGDFYSDVSDEQIPLLKQAQKTHLAGMFILTNKLDYKNAVTELESAQVLYRRAGDNIEPELLDFVIAYCLNRDSKFTRSSEKFGELYINAQKEKHKWLNFQASYWLAANDFSSKKFSAGLARLESAAVIGTEIDDNQSQQKLLSLLTETYFLVGQYENAFDTMEKNLRLAELPSAIPSEKWRTLNLATRFFYKTKYFHTAVIYEQEAMSLARELGDSTFIYTSSVDLGLATFALGDSDEALRLIEQGQNLSETFIDGKYKDKCIAYTNLLLGHIQRQSRNYSDAAESYQKAINFYDSNEFQVFRYDAHRGLLLSYLAEKNSAGVEDEMEKILKIFDDYREKIVEEQNRTSFFNNEQDIYDIAIEVNYGKADFTKAFDYSEESRSRSLLDLQNSAAQVSEKTDRKPEIRFSSNVTKPYKLAQIQAEMPDNVQLLQYSVLSDKILIWLITKNDLIVKKTEISSEDLEQKILTYVDLISQKGDIDEQKILSGELFNLLIQPVKEEINPGKEVFIIPDKILFKLPFNTLFSEKYLVEDYKISYAPSANVFLFCSKKASELGRKSAENLLSIGDPAFNQAEYKNSLQPLPAAKLEAAEIADLYSNPAVFTGEKATKKQIRDKLKTSDVVHFAGHYVVDDRVPMSSALVLAGDQRQDTDLTNYEIISERHPQIRLIVLSACQTGVEKYYNGEGMIGASRTFLATGVPLVVASQWAVDSDASKELMIRFHRFRKIDSLSTSESLRRSQIELLRSSKYNHPYYWAAFAAIGGNTTF